MITKIKNFIKTVKEGIKTTKELDNSMTELTKVSKATVEEIKREMSN